MISDEVVEAAAKDPEPQPGDGPDYHTEHAFWLSRHTSPYTEPFMKFPDHEFTPDEYGHNCTGCAPDSSWKCDAVAHGLGEHERGLKLLEAVTNPYRSQVVTKVGAMDDALRMYQEGVALAVITERTGISYSGLMTAKKDRGIPDRPQRADGTDRSQA